MALTPLPTPPSRSDAANFDARAEDLLGAFPTLVTELNALSSDLTTKSTAATTAATTATNKATAASNSAADAAASAAAAQTWNPANYVTKVLGLFSGLLKTVGSTYQTAMLELERTGAAARRWALSVDNDRGLSIVDRTNGDAGYLTITTAGNLLVGMTGTSSYRGNFRGSLGFIARSTGGASSEAAALWNEADTGDNVLAAYATDATYTLRGSVTFNRAAGVIAYNTTSDRRAKDLLGAFSDSGAMIDAIAVHLGMMKGATQARPMFVADELQDGGASFAVTGDRDAVNDDGDPVYQQVADSVLVPVLWAELHGVRRRLAALEAAQATPAN